jgi:hypothetical protein
MNVSVQLAEVARIAAEIDALCGDDEACFADMIEGETDVHTIIGKLHDRLAADAELVNGITARQTDLAERKARLVTRSVVNKAAIGKFLRAALLKSIELPEATYSVRDGRPKLEVVDKDAVPEPFLKHTPTPDKTAINEAFADADDLPNWLVREPARDVVTARTK